MLPDSFYDTLKQRLRAGDWSSGERLPSIRKLASSAGVSYHNVVSAYGRLVSEGLLASQPGRGYFVVHGGEPGSVWREPECTDRDPLFRLLQAGPTYTKLGCGWLPPAWRDTALLAKA
ncbi:GntR family transcriptional regulator, partial [Pseudomonas viridiflava]